MAMLSVVLYGKPVKFCHKRFMCYITEEGGEGLYTGLCGDLREGQYILEFCGFSDVTKHRYLGNIVACPTVLDACQALVKQLAEDGIIVPNSLLAKHNLILVPEEEDEEVKQMMAEIDAEVSDG